MNKACALNPTLCATKFKDSLRITDSLHITDSITRTVIPATTLGINLSNLCDSLGRLKPTDVKIKGGKSTLSIKSNNVGGLDIECKTDSLESVIRKLESQSKSYRSQVIESQSTLIRETKSKAKWYLWLLTGFVLGFIFGVVGMVNIKR